MALTYKVAARKAYDKSGKKTVPTYWVFRDGKKIYCKSKTRNQLAFYKSRLSSGQLGGKKPKKCIYKSKTKSKGITKKKRQYCERYKTMKDGKKKCAAFNPRKSKRK
jgi:hypothetical protein